MTSNVTKYVWLKLNVNNNFVINELRKKYTLCTHGHFQMGKIKKIYNTCNNQSAEVQIGWLFSTMHLH